jgi:hypothetical protein
VSHSTVIHWCSSVLNAAEDVQSALHELADKLKESYPNLPLVEVRELSQSERKHLDAYLRRPRAGFKTNHSEPTPLDGKLVFVFCERDDPIAKAARKENPLADWGAAREDDYALAWTPDNKFLIWHEAMHLLFAKDCYDSAGKTTCEEPLCIMQYVPCDQNCGGDLRLCRANVQRLIANSARPSSTRD